MRVLSRHFVQVLGYPTIVSHQHVRINGTQLAVCLASHIGNMPQAAEQSIIMSELTLSEFRLLSSGCASCCKSISLLLPSVPAAARVSSTPRRPVAGI